MCGNVNRTSPSANGRPTPPSPFGAVAGRAATRTPRRRRRAVRPPPPSPAVSERTYMKIQTGSRLRAPIAQNGILARPLAAATYGGSGGGGGGGAGAAAALRGVGPVGAAGADSPVVAGVAAAAQPPTFGRRLAALPAPARGRRAGRASASAGVRGSRSWARPMTGRPTRAPARRPTMGCGGAVPGESRSSRGHDRRRAQAAGNHRRPVPTAVKPGRDALVHNLGEHRRGRARLAAYDAGTSADELRGRCTDARHQPSRSGRA